MKDYRMKLDHHVYQLKSIESKSHLKEIEQFLNERINLQNDMLSFHQKITLTLINLASEYLKIQDELKKVEQKNQQLTTQLHHIKKDSLYEVVLDDLQEKVEEELNRARHNRQDEAVMGARYVLNHISKEQIKRKKDL